MGKLHTHFLYMDLDKAMGMTRSHVLRFTLIGGLTGFTLATLMIWFMNAYDHLLMLEETILYVHLSLPCNV